MNPKTHRLVIRRTDNPILSWQVDVYRLNPQDYLDGSYTATKWGAKLAGKRIVKRDRKGYYEKLAEKKIPEVIEL